MPNKVATTTTPPPPSHTPQQGINHHHPTITHTPARQKPPPIPKHNHHPNAKPPSIQHRFSTDSNKQIATNSNRQTQPPIHHFIKQTPTATFTDLATISNKQTPTTPIIDPATKKPQTHKPIKTHSPLP